MIKAENLPQIETKPKLITILRNAKNNSDEISLEHQSKQADINTQQEILAVKQLINQQDVTINQTLQANPFSASKLYQVRIEKELLERKLKALEAIHIELF